MTVRSLCRYVFGLLYIATIFCAGCGPIGKRVKLDRDLSPDEVKYWENVESRFAVTVDIAGEQYDGHGGDFAVGGLFPLWFEYQVVSVASRGIAAGHYVAVPALPLLHLSWENGATFSEGELQKQSRSFSVYPLFRYRQLGDRRGALWREYHFLPILPVRLALQKKARARAPPR